MNSSHVSGVGARLSLSWAIARTAISRIQDIEASWPLFDRFLIRPLAVWYKRWSPGHSGSKIAIAVGVVTMLGYRWFGPASSRFQQSQISLAAFSATRHSRASDHRPALAAFDVESASWFVSAAGNPPSVPLVRRSEHSSTHHKRPAGVADLLHFGEHRVAIRRMEEPRNVLNEHPSRSHFANDPAELEPQSAAVGGIVCGSDSFSRPGERNLLARECAVDDIDWFKVMFSTFPHVAEFGHIRPMLVEDPQAERVLLDLPHSLEPRHFEAEVHAPNAGEKAAVRQLPRRRSSSSCGPEL